MGHFTIPCLVHIVIPVLRPSLPVKTLLITLNNHFNRGRLSAHRIALCPGLGSGHFNHVVDISAVLGDNLGTSISGVVEAVV